MKAPALRSELLASDVDSTPQPAVAKSHKPSIDREKLRHKATVRVEVIAGDSCLVISYAGRDVAEKLPGCIASLESQLARMTDQLMAHVEGAFAAVAPEVTSGE